MLTLKLTTIGNSVGMVLPREVLDKLHLAKGDQVYLTESPDGWRLTPYSPEFAVQMTEAPDHEKAPQRAARAGEVREIVWVEESVVLALHEEHLAEHGGGPGPA
jgi:putative addiction module antidote